MKRLLLTALTLLTLATGVFAMQAQPAYADAKSDVCSGVGAASGRNGCDANGVDLGGVIKAVINVLSGIVGLTAVIMIVVGGFKYITSGGDSSRVSSAKSTLIYAIVGLIFAAMAQFIVQFVLNKTK